LTRLLLPCLYSPATTTDSSRSASRRRARSTRSTRSSRPRSRALARQSVRSAASLADGDRSSVRPPASGRPPWTPAGGAPADEERADDEPADEESAGDDPPGGDPPGAAGGTRGRGGGSARLGELGGGGAVGGAAGRAAAGGRGASRVAVFHSRNASQRSQNVSDCGLSCPHLAQTITALASPTCLFSSADGLTTPRGPYPTTTRGRANITNGSTVSGEAQGAVRCPR
jgi:hypothetical protein